MSAFVDTNTFSHRSSTLPYIIPNYLKAQHRYIQGKISEEMAHQCTICYNDFSFDPSASNKALLPVQSRVCSHVLCFGCVVAIYRNNQQAPPRPFQEQSSPRSITEQHYREEEDDTTVDDDDTYASTVKHYRQPFADSIPCPECRLPNAHNPFKPIVNRSLCEMLTERQKIIKMVPGGTYTSDDTGISTTTPRSSLRVVVDGNAAANSGNAESPRQLSPANSLNNRKSNRSLVRNNKNSSHQQQMVMLASNLADTVELVASLARHYMDQMVTFLQVQYKEERPFLVSHISQAVYLGSYYLFWGGTAPGSSGSFPRHHER